MNSKQRKTLGAIFRDPVSKTIVFADMESLLRSLGCDIEEGDGSRVIFVKDNVRLEIHRPHPQKEAKPYQVRAVRKFLIDIGEKP